MNIPTIQEIKTKNFSWIDISRCSPEEMKYLEKKQKIHSNHLNDCLSLIQRPKLDTTQEYDFMILLFPVYNRKTRKVTSTEVDFFISPNQLITIHRGELSTLINFFNSYKIDQSRDGKYSYDNPSVLVHEMLKRLFFYCHPILDVLSGNISSIENHIFQGYERKMVKEILIAKTNIVNFRKIMQAHRMVISRLLKKNKGYLAEKEYKKYFDELLEITDDIWGNLENLKQSIDATEQTNNSLISFQLNDVIKILTTISVIILPITLIATIFGMNLNFMPLTNNPFAFWIIVIIMIITFSGLVYYFKKKKWL